MLISFYLFFSLLYKYYCDSNKTIIESAGACGFGEFGRNINGGGVGAVSKLYRNGTGCGACYQVHILPNNMNF